MAGILSRETASMTDLAATQYGTPMTASAK